MESQTRNNTLRSSQMPATANSD